ncbi:hypothetical protein AB8S08_07100 [Pseudidiomarina sp. PP-1MA]|uniref:Uncharacterized protein n=2 Tax=Alteromonadales TaxID=135622 RepID=A0AB39X752_9GAMM
MFSIEEFKSVNTNVNVFDYIHALFSNENVAPDLVLAIDSIFRPKFKEVHGVLFVEELYSSDKHESLEKANKSNGEISYWVNLIDLTSVFEGVDFQVVLSIAEKIKTSWNKELNRDYCGYNAQACLIKEEESREIYLTLELKE